MNWYRRHNSLGLSNIHSSYKDAMKTRLMMQSNREWVDRLDKKIKFVCKSYISLLCEKTNELLREIYEGNLVSEIDREEAYSHMQIETGLEHEPEVFSKYRLSGYYKLNMGKGDLTRSYPVNFNFTAYWDGSIICDVMCYLEGEHPKYTSYGRPYMIKNYRLRGDYPPYDYYEAL